MPIETSLSDSRQPGGVPRIIHYCWFSQDPLPTLIQRCIDSWRQVMPDYQIRLWDANSFNFDSLPFTQDAIRLRKWAFAADYVRLYALYTEGGIYLDSDVRVFRRFDSFLNYGFFTSHEVHPYNRTEEEKRKLDENGCVLNPDDLVLWMHIQAAIMGAEAGHPFLKACLDFYDGKRLAGPDGEPLCTQFIIGPHISKIAESFGYRYHLGEQHLRENMAIFAPEVFVGDAHFLRDDSYAIHLCNGSWHERSTHEQIVHKLSNRFPALSPALKTWDKLWKKARAFTSLKVSPHD